MTGTTAATTKAMAATTGIHPPAAMMRLVSLLWFFMFLFLFLAQGARVSVLFLSEITAINQCVFQTQKVQDIFVYFSLSSCLEFNAHRHKRNQWTKSIIRCFPQS
jgi:hypothetical protein